MEQSDVFDQLVKSLTTKERREMLSKLSKSFESIGEPIHSPDEMGVFNINLAYHELAWWQKIWIFLVSLFGSQTKEEVVESMLLTRLSVSVNEQSGNTLDFHRRVFLESFQEAFKTIDESLKEIRPLLGGISGQNRSNFVVYLAAMKITLEHQDLMQVTSVESIAAIATGSERSLKQQLRQDLDHRLSEIPNRSRAEMRNAVRMVDLVFQLGQAPLSGVVECFETDTGSGLGECPFDYAQRNLELITSIVTGLSTTIDPGTLEAAILFVSREADSLSGEELANWLHDEMERIGHALNVIRETVRRLSLVRVLHLIHRDLAYEVKPASGGEEWFVVYRRFFRNRIDQRVAEFQTQSHFFALTEEAVQFLGRRLLPFPEYPRSIGDLPAPFYWSVALLHTFFTTLYTSILPVLKIILVNGDFYKAGNRAQFNDSYNELKAFQQSWDTFALLFQEMGNNETTLVRSAEWVAQVEDRFLQIRSNFTASLELMVNLLNGILYARPGSTYDTLANYGQISGRHNAEFIEELKISADQLAQLLNLMQEIFRVETRAKELELQLKSG